ncbi:MAG TPA: GWxTD domain-containing protein, partial [Gemmatimonadaceae bacterium]
PVAVFRARGRNARGAQPDIVIRPRATAVFGHDSVAEFYVETYAAPEQPQPSAVEALITGDGGFTVFADTVPIVSARQAVRSAVIRVPIARLGFGALTLCITELDSSRRASAPGASTPLLVTFGEGLAVAPFEEMLQYLRYFTTQDRLRSLRDTTPEGRFRAWDEFLRETDRITATSENEALREYLDRLSDANIRFREDNTSGWLTDRAMVFSTLGEPDNFVFDPSAAAPQGSRVLVWEYSRYRARFVFVDPSGQGRWRLTPSSEADYDAVMRRLGR